ncbi:unnamed protein product [Rodentolepis nana]|uniref:Uncharacterized protein n=1 Tax=Rodentolepis nana TaxID=102285 RepID=A0A3P7SLQ5_RODNA|nr:unnamed protein product [Rodentolepis nana]
MEVGFGHSDPVNQWNKAALEQRADMFENISSPLPTKCGRAQSAAVMRLIWGGSGLPQEIFFCSKIPPRIAKSRGAFD